MTALLGMIGLMFAAGCFNPPVERYKANKAMEAGDYEQADRRLNKVIERNPGDWEAHYLMGKSHLGQDRALQAQTEFEQALAVKDESKHTPKILDGMAESLHKQGRNAELYAFLDEQIERYEGWEDYARKARFLARAGDIDSAALAYRQAAIFSRNTSDEIYIEIADFYEGLGNYDHAIQALKWAYFINEENPTLPNRFRRLGVVPGPTLKEQPPQPEYEGESLFKLPNLINE